MSSYIKLFEDFLQQKENDVKNRAGSQEEEMEENTTENMQPVPAPCVEAKMEHSYTRDSTRSVPELTTGLAAARTVLVRRPPQCPSCHTHPLDEHDFNDGNQVEVPGYLEIQAKEAMNECARVASYVQNNNKDDEDWEPYVNQIGWTFTQKSLFKRVALILDNDQLGRLANANIPNEPMQRRVLVDKSAASMRKLLASIAWDVRLIQWLHSVLVENLPATYMASYLDILQTLHHKLPTLVDKMIFGRPVSMAKELMAPVMKKKWEPTVITKDRKLNHSAVIVTVPTLTNNGVVPKRIQKWYDYLASITEIVHVTLPVMSDIIKRDTLEQVAEKIVSLTRVKIQDLRSDNAARSIILIGFNAGSALALQVAMSENIACVICMGFAFNTLNGVRGMPDDRILDIKIPILFVIGQNSAKTSPEEMEHLREKLQSESSVVVVGSADDALRVPKLRRKIENVTQATVDTMIVKEMFDFVNKTLTNRPGPRQPTPIGIATAFKGKASNGDNSGPKVNTGQRKRKAEPVDDDEKLAQLKTKYGRPRTKALAPGQKVNKPIAVTKLQTQQTQQASNQISPNSTINDDLSAAMQTILSEANDTDFATNANNVSGPKAMTSFDIVAQPKSASGSNSQKPHIISSTVLPNINTARLRVLPSNQFIQLRTPMQSQSKVYTIKPTGLISQSQLSVTAAQNPSIGSIIKTAPNPAATGQQQIFTLKSPNGKTTQFVTAAPPAAQQKYTVVKTPNGGTTLQLTTNAPKTVTETSTGNLDLSNIIDMPIVFADKDGNLTDSVVQSNEAETKAQLTTIKQNPTSNVGQLIINPQLRKDGSGASTLTINKSSTILPNAQSGNKGKVVFINRNNIKPCSSIISRNNLQGLQKYTKVLVNKTETVTASSSTVQTTRCNTQITQIGGTNQTVAPISSAVKQVNIQPIKTLNSGSRIVNIGSKMAPQYKIISTANSGTVLATGNGDNVRNIVIKSAIKPMAGNINTQLLNRNIVVRKFVKPIAAGINPKITSSINVLNSTNTSSSSSIAQLLQDGGNEMSSTVGTTAMQSSPKIITLNPVNPSAKLD